MTTIFDSKTSTIAIRYTIANRATPPKRGLAKRLADALKCHPTFISQVTLGKAWLNNDQGLLFCKYFRFTEDETQFLFDLLNKDRSHTSQGKAYFEKRLQVQREKRLELKTRFQNTHHLSSEDETRYYDSWLQQVIHMLCQCEGRHTIANLAQRLRLNPNIVADVLSDLERMGLVGRRGESFICLQPDVHLAHSSPTIKRLHSVWRTKTMELMSANRELPGMHFSSLFACDKDTLLKLKTLWTDSLDHSRKLILDAPSKNLAVFCMDLFPFVDGTD